MPLPRRSAPCHFGAATHPNRDPSLKSVLILFAHPALQKSRVNRVLIEGVRELPGVTFHDLYEAYPDFDIDVPREQGLLLDHDVIVFQHPFFWYSTPAILKEWQDLVLEHGFAYGSGGDRLHGKIFFDATTAGGLEAAYRSEGYNHFSIAELLQPLEQTADLCGMAWLPPFALFGSRQAVDENRVDQHLSDWRRVLEALRDDRMDLQRARGCMKLNENLDDIIREAA